ncbi:MAG: ferrous iron transport protein B [Verrucomicrobia bacterium]|nr:ferrous iron transport protein B [Verrucomicrobiota bacterium]
MTAVSRPFLAALTGNPNCGKTTLFNALTGLRAKVGNYAGVTVERKEGRLASVPKDAPPTTILDLPGTYSLMPQSVDEKIARDVLLQESPGVAPPSLVVVVIDASNLERNLYFATQVLEVGYPTVVALNMMDVAERNGQRVDAEALSRRLGAPVFPMSANLGAGVEALRLRILECARGQLPNPARHRFGEYPAALEEAATRIERLLIEEGTPASPASLSAASARLKLCDPKYPREGETSSPALAQAVRVERVRLEQAGVDWRTLPIEERYAAVTQIHHDVVDESGAPAETFSDRLDRVLTHKLWGAAIFIAIMAVMFQSIFTFAEVPMTAIEAGFAALGHAIGTRMAPGDLNSLLVDGVIAGVGSVVVFLPQILLLFLFIGLLEDTGYMARAAFLMDRLMSKVGLHGKSFIPMLSSFACAIPGIMATRTIETPKDRLATILVAPLMSCSARLPVYVLLIAACIPSGSVLGIVWYSTLVMLSMYLLGIVAALIMAWVFKSTLLKGQAPMLIMELPPYRRPVLKVVLRHMWERSKLFLRRAGTVILGINILLWFLASYPKNPALEQRFEQERAALEARRASLEPGAFEAAQKEVDHVEAGELLRASYAGMLGRATEPFIAPLGFDWKIGIGIVASFAAREVFVSTMSTVYNLGSEDEDDPIPNLAKVLREQKRADGRLLYTPLLGMTLMVFYVFALQCVSTVAVVRRETNGWKWPVIQWLYMGALAWGFAFLVYRGGLWLGFQG